MGGNGDNTGGSGNNSNVNAVTVGGSASASSSNNLNSMTVEDAQELQERREKDAAEERRKAEIAAKVAKLADAEWERQWGEYYRRQEEEREKARKEEEREQEEKRRQKQERKDEKKMRLPYEEKYAIVLLFGENYGGIRTSSDAPLSEAEITAMREHVERVDAIKYRIDMSDSGHEWDRSTERTKHRERSERIVGLGVTKTQAVRAMQKWLEKVGQTWKKRGSR
jgi:hypothetical protein